MFFNAEAPVRISTFVAISTFWNSEAETLGNIGDLVGAAGTEFASLLAKSNKDNGVAPPPRSNWSLCSRRL